MTTSQAFPKTPQVDDAGFHIAQELIPALGSMVGVSQGTGSRAEAGLNSMDARLSALRALRFIEAAVGEQQALVVRHLRSQLATWQMIGDALCMTRSGAQQKFGDR